MKLTVNKVSYLLFNHALYINNTNIKNVQHAVYFFCQKKIYRFLLESKITYIYSYDISL